MDVDYFSNHDLVGKAMNVTLREILAPHVAQELSANYGANNWWSEGVLKVLYEHQKINLPPSGNYAELVYSLDIKLCLLLIEIHWRKIFSKKHSMNYLNWVRELKQIRNEWAHTNWKMFDSFYTTRALDTMLRLCEQLDDENVDKLRDMLSKRFSGNVEGSSTVNFVNAKRNGNSSAGSSRKKLPTNTNSKKRRGSSMAISLQKGQKVDLTKGNPSLKKILIGLGWDTNKYDGGFDFDLDAAAFLLGANGKVNSDDDFVFYNNLKHKSGSVEHMGDNLTGAGED